MTTRKDDYYERYWEDPSSAPPHRDPTTPQRLTLLRKYGDEGEGKMALDLGCGLGVFTDALTQRGFRTRGIDLSENALAAARDKWPSYRFDSYNEDGMIPLDNECVDLVWCSEVIEHQFDVYNFLCEINRTMKTGGSLILTTPYHGLIKNLLIVLSKFPKHFDPYRSHIRFFNKQSLAKCLADAGFTATKWVAYGRIWPVYRSLFVCATKTSAPAQKPPIWE